jgi:hypothetical protein
MRILVVVLVSFLPLFAGSRAFAQEHASRDGEVSDAEPGANVRPASVLPAVLAPKAATPKTEHKFLDVKNALALTAVGISLAGDGWSTQRALAVPGTHEVNPVARPFVSSRVGEIGYSGASFALVAGGMYLAHHTHHHKWERMAPFAIAGWESLLTAWNWHVAH